MVAEQKRKAQEDEAHRVEVYNKEQEKAAKEAAEKKAAEDAIAKKAEENAFEATKASSQAAKAQDEAQ